MYRPHIAARKKKQACPRPCGGNRLKPHPENGCARVCGMDMNGGEVAAVPSGMLTGIGCSDGSWHLCPPGVTVKPKKRRSIRLSYTKKRRRSGRLFVFPF